MHGSLKTAKPSPVGPHKGAGLGNLEIVPGTLFIGSGLHVEEKSEMEPGSESTDSGGYWPTHFCPLKCKQTQMALLNANKPHQKGLIGAAWLPVCLYVLALSPNDHPTTAQVSMRTVKGRWKKCIFHPTHVGNFLVETVISHLSLEP